MNIKGIQLPNTDLIRIVRRVSYDKRTVEVISLAANPGKENLLPFLAARNVVDNRGNLLGFSHIAIYAHVPVIVDGKATYPGSNLDSSFDSLSQSKHHF